MRQFVSQSPCQPHIVPGDHDALCPRVLDLADLLHDGGQPAQRQALPVRPSHHGAAQLDHHALRILQLPPES